jgi:acyl-CoA thioesterase II
MSEYARGIVDLLTVRPSAKRNVFVGDTEPYGVPGRIYGGHFVAQSLSAVFATVDENRLTHSIHAYYHKTGDSGLPIHYGVETLRDGKSFSSRRVVATQNDDVVFSMAASLKLRDEDELFQSDMPQVVAPEIARAQREASGRPTPAGPPTAGGRVELEQTTNAFESQAELIDGEARSVDIRNWLRVLESEPLSDRQNQMMLAFISDGPLPFCAAILHGDPFGTHQHMSLDHTLWFHRTADVRQWTLFDAHCIATADGRGLNDGRLFSREGELLVSVRQESLLRRLR